VPEKTAPPQAGIRSIRRGSCGRFVGFGIFAVLSAFLAGRFDAPSPVLPGGGSSVRSGLVVRSGISQGGSLVARSAPETRYASTSGPSWFEPRAGGVRIPSRAASTRMLCIGGPCLDLLGGAKGFRLSAGHIVCTMAYGLAFRGLGDRAFCTVLAAMREIIV
jgi:hypothetical protein